MTPHSSVLWESSFLGIPPQHIPSISSTPICPCLPFSSPQCHLLQELIANIPRMPLFSGHIQSQNVSREVNSTTT